MRSTVAYGEAVGSLVHTGPVPVGTYPAGFGICLGTSCLVEPKIFAVAKTFFFFTPSQVCGLIFRELSFDQSSGTYRRHLVRPFRPFEVVHEVATLWNIFIAYCDPSRDFSEATEQHSSLQ